MEIQINFESKKGTKAAPYVVQILNEFHTIIYDCQKSFFDFRLLAKTAFDNVLKASKWVNYGFQKRGLEYMAYNEVFEKYF